MNEKIRIYQLVPRYFTNTCTNPVFNGTIEQNGCGKLEDLNETVLSEIAALGINHVWLTGILRHATGTDYGSFGMASSHPDILKGRGGSPYAIKDYFDVDPDLAVSVPDRMQEFDELIDRMHKMDLRAIIDFVPNHVARDYQSISKPSTFVDLGETDTTDLAFDPANNFYYIPGQSLHLGDFKEFPAKATGNDIFHSEPSHEDWYETIKLNYGVNYGDGTNHFDPIPGTWKKMTEILLFWAGRKVDGFRCDMAGMVPVNFWSYAIGAVKSLFPDIIFIAELYEPSRYRDFIEVGGFDFLYDKVGLYDTLRSVITKQASARAISHVWQSLEGLDAHMVRFLENHDEHRIASTYFAGDPWKGLPGMAVAALMSRGPVLVYAGQEVGESAEEETGYSGNDGRTTIFDYTSMPEIRKWYNSGACNGELLDNEQTKLRVEYSRLLKWSSSPVIASGSFYDLMWVNTDLPVEDNVYAFIRFLPEALNPASPESGELGLTIWLIAASFDPSIRQVKIRIPLHAIEFMGLSTDQRFSFSSIEPAEKGFQNLLATQIISSGITMNIGPSGYAISQAFFPA